MTSFSFPIVPIHRSLAASLLAVGLLRAATARAATGPAAAECPHRDWP